MLLALSLAFYAALGGVTFARLTRPMAMIETRRARVWWVLAAAAASVLWPLTFAVFAGLAWLARRESRR